MSSPTVILWSGLGGALDRFARERHPPDRGRGILENYIITRHFPVD